MTLGNLLLLPLVLLFLNSLPWQQSIEAAKFYISNNCQANGGSVFVLDNPKPNFPQTKLTLNQTKPMEVAFFFRLSLLNSNNPKLN